MGNIFEYLKTVPEYLQYVWQTMPVVFIAAILAFVISLFNGRLSSIVRTILIVLLVIYALIGGFTSRSEYGPQMVWVAAIALILLVIARSIVFAIQTSRQNKINAKIEARALAKAARRRGSFRSRLDESVKTPAPGKEAASEKMDSSEISAIVQGVSPEEAVKLTVPETAPPSQAPESPAAPYAPPTGAEADPAYLQAQAAATAQLEESLPEHLNADELYSMMNRLSDLHNLGILTDEEFSKKKAELLQRV